MLSRIQCYETPPIPHAPQEESFNTGITTRLMAKRQSDKIRRNSTGLVLSGPSAENSLLGSSLVSNSLPNSNVLPNQHIHIPIVVPLRNDEAINNIIVSANDDAKPNPLDKMRESVRRRSRTSSKSDYIDEGSKSTNSSSDSARRVSQRTSEIILISGTRKPTYESLKEAIANSVQFDGLINIDEHPAIIKASITSERRPSNLSDSKRRHSSNASRVTFEQNPVDLGRGAQNAVLHTIINTNVSTLETRRRNS